MTPLGFHINARGFVKSLIRDQLRAEVVKITTGLGPAKVAWLVKNNRSLSSLLPVEEEARLRGKAPRYARGAAMISNEEFRAMLPDWVGAIVASQGEQGEAWLQDQIRWMRGFFGGAYAERQAMVQGGTGGDFRITRVRLQATGTEAASQPAASPDRDTGAPDPPGPAPRGAEEDE